VPESSQMDIVSTRTDTDEMEVEDMRRERIPSDKSFDWNTFLREQCGFSDEEVSYCLPKVEDIDEDELPAVTKQSLKDLGIDKPTLRFKIRSAVKGYLSRKQRKQ